MFEKILKDDSVSSARGRRGALSKVIVYDALKPVWTPVEKNDKELFSVIPTKMQEAYGLTESSGIQTASNDVPTFPQQQAIVFRRNRAEQNMHRVIHVDDADEEASGEPHIKSLTTTPRFKNNIVSANLDECYKEAVNRVSMLKKKHKLDMVTKGSKNSLDENETDTANFNGEESDTESEVLNMDENKRTDTAKKSKKSKSDAGFSEFTQDTRLKNTARVKLINDLQDKYKHAKEMVDRLNLVFDYTEKRREVSENIMSMMSLKKLPNVRSFSWPKCLDPELEADPKDFEINTFQGSI